MSAMIERKDLLTLNYYRYRQPFTGSVGEMRYRIEPVCDEDKKPVALRLTIWRGPNAFDTTDDDLKEAFEDEFSEETMERFVALLNSTAERMNQT